MSLFSLLLLRTGSVAHHTMFLNNKVNSNRVFHKRDKIIVKGFTRFLIQELLSCSNTTLSQCKSAKQNMMLQLLSLRTVSVEWQTRSNSIVSNFLLLEIFHYQKSLQCQQSRFSTIRYFCQILAESCQHLWGRAKIKLVISGEWTQDLLIIISVFYWLVSIQLLVWISMAFIKAHSIDSRNNQSPKCEVVHETKFTSEISCPIHTCLAQSVEH